MKDRTNDNLDFRRGVIYERQVLQDERASEREREYNGGTGHKREMKWQFHIA